MTVAGGVAFVGNSLPRRCGIATFTTDLQQAVACLPGVIDTCIVAMTDIGHQYDYPAAVRLQIDDSNLPEYERAAAFLNAGQYSVVSLQHEFGIFGGSAGSHILALIAELTIPLVTTLHTVLSQPSSEQRRVLGRIADASARIIVMAEKGRELLRTVYRLPAEKIEVIPHGTPDFAFVEPDEAKAAYGFIGRSVILTFGLLSPSKGIEIMIDAMPAILKSRPDAVYVVLGATHPNLVRDRGEVYRQGLIARVRELGITDHVVFLDRFVDQATLLRFISMCDVYVTPYLNEAQMTSGTLAYSFGLGKAVVSTPYWHASELLTDGRGILVPFGDSVAIGREIAALLTDGARRSAMRQRAYASSRSMTWPRIAERYLAAFEVALSVPRPRASPRARESQELPSVKVSHLLSMCDDTGLFQHALHCVPDRSHGYCVDDNARALLVACAINKVDQRYLNDDVTNRFAAFLQHAWNPDTRRFRNFMGFDRRWLEPQGSEDSHGRSLWALGECARNDLNPSRQRWACSLFTLALPTVEGFTSPRALSFALIGLNAYIAVASKDSPAQRLRTLLADRLLAIFDAVETEDWQWFEESLAYDNARLCQALILTGESTGTQAYVNAGLDSLRWLMRVQTTPAGTFRPVGSQSFGMRRLLPRAFDQQPVEAAASIAACLLAWRSDQDPHWIEHAARAFAWFLGNNDLSAPLVDLETGSCRDGLHPDRPNENRGGESVVSYMLALADMREFARTRAEQAKSAPLLALTA